jgi:hypothetical protein
MVWNSGVKVRILFAGQYPDSQQGKVGAVSRTLGVPSMAPRDGTMADSREAGRSRWHRC